MKILTLDIETSPNLAYVWGMFKQNVGLNQLIDTTEILSVAAKWLDNDQTMFWSKFQGKDVMLKGVHDVLMQADAVVTYNGARFDIPHLNREFLLAGMMPPDSYHNIDLLRVVKRRFRFTSNKLDHIASQLGLGNKVSHSGFDLWVRCMANDKEAWQEMEGYNRHDVVLTEQVYLKLLPWITNHPNHAAFTDSDRPVCPNCGSEHVIKNGYCTTPTLRYQRYRCAKCYTPIRGRTTVQPKEKRQATLTQDKTGA